MGIQVKKTVTFLEIPKKYQPAIIQQNNDKLKKFISVTKAEENTKTLLDILVHLRGGLID